MSIQRTVNMGPETTGVVTFMNWSSRVVTIRHEYEGAEIEASYRIGSRTGCTKRTVHVGAPIRFKTKTGRIGNPIRSFSNDDIVEIHDPKPNIDPVALAVLKEDDDWRQRLEGWVVRAVTHGPGWTKWDMRNNGLATYSSDHGRLVVNVVDEETGLIVRRNEIILPVIAELPETILQSMKGRPIGEIVGHRWLQDPRITIDAHHIEGERSVIRMQSPLIRIDALLRDA